MIKDVNYNNLKKFIGLDYLYCKSTGKKVYTEVKDLSKFEPNLIHIYIRIDGNTQYYSSSFDTHVEHLSNSYMTMKEHREATITSLLS